MVGDEAAQLPLPVALHLHRERDIRAVEAEHELLDVTAEELLGDVLARHLVGGRCQRRNRHPGGKLAQPAQRRVLGTERRPHCEMRCASSMANSVTGSRASAASMRSVINRSGAM